METVCKFRFLNHYDEALPKVESDIGADKLESEETGQPGWPAISRARRLARFSSPLQSRTVTGYDGNHVQVEINQIITNTNRLRAEANNIVAERLKLMSEQGKLERERFWYPMVIGGIVGGALLAAGVLLAKLFTMH